MSEPVITAEGLAKKFVISHKRPERNRTLRDVIAEKAKGFVRARSKDALPTREEFYALKDVDFEVQSGDRLGIIGRNGAGKSTLLKILSRITEPSAGRVTIRGRVASLLEVGTGFHPELTGRENIFLNGAILGMSQLEVRAKFDEIVAFAEVERFLDTPVKRYSSGMYVRLAFAVAAHLEPEILVVDEVLAVGDAQFQQKCLGKMEDVSSKGGRTVLFVSHNTGVIAQLCNKAILLDRGQLVCSGDTASVVDRYVRPNEAASSLIEGEAAPGQNRFLRAFMSDEQSSPRVDYRYDEQIVVTIEMMLNDFTEDLELAMRLMDKLKHPVFTIHERLKGHTRGAGNPILFKVVVPGEFLTPGRYSWVMCINQPGIKNSDLRDDVLPFNVVDTGSEFSRYAGADYGCVFARYAIQPVTQ
ncbi:MAG TPA: polysaccharide ABC transporter ATP-binding protein [Polyangiaceae bacterium]|nr:polysaccharide ABC transporter ATP-binding protein [Polyangiaceae bacterium]